jgi:two-component system response regulator AtoC
MGTFKIFIVEDDPWYGEILEYHLSMNVDYEISRFGTLKDCFAQLSRKPDLITLDYSLPDGTGAEALRKLRTQLPNTPIIIVSAQKDVAIAVELLKQGATDYFVKDDTTKDLLWNAVARIRANQAPRTAAEVVDELEGQDDFSQSVHGNSPAIQKIFGLMHKASRTTINVSITGETGTGKEVVARAIHQHSERKRKPMVVVNMAAIPKELIESELFGHERGAFTGAAGRRIGKFEEANKGTIFLDEIAELDLSVQSKLLRVLQERELVRVGGNERIPLDVRLVVATHKNLLEEVRKGNFREDLYYRTLGLPIELPPLRERGSDTALLAMHFLQEFCRQNKMPMMRLSIEASRKLDAYPYPGNVRELKAIIELSAVMCDGEEIRAKDINFPAEGDQELPTQHGKTLKEYTADIIRYYLKRHDNNVQAVAAKLDIGKSTIYKMIQNKELILE